MDLSRELLLHVYFILYQMVSVSGTLYFSKEKNTLAFRLVPNVSLNDCKKECMARTKCHSINYFRMSKTCRLNRMTLTEDTDTVIVGSVYSAKVDWDDISFSSCSCQPGEKCIVSATGTTCEIEECDKLESQDLFDMNTVGAKTMHNMNCIQDVQQFDRDRTFISDTTPYLCHADGIWRPVQPPSGDCTIVAAVLRHGTLVDPYHAWERGDNSSSDTACLLSPTCAHNYRNSLIDNWSGLSVSEVRLSIFRQGSESQYVLFNGTGSSMTDWFAQNRVTSSSWNDIMTSSTNHFSLYGIDTSTSATRRMLMSESYSGCNGDNGWFVAVYMPQGSTVVCPYEMVGVPYPVFLYAKRKMASFFQSANMVLADYIYITVRLTN